MKAVISLAFILMATYGGRLPASGAVYGGRLPTFGGLYGNRLPMPMSDVSPIPYPTYNWEHTPLEGDDLPLFKYYPKFGKFVPKYLMEKYGVESDIKKVVDYKKKVVPIMTMDPEAPEVDVNVKVPNVYGLPEKSTDIKLIPTSHYVPTTTPLGYPGYPMNPEYFLPYNVNRYRYGGYPYNYRTMWNLNKVNPTMTMHPLLRYISGYPYNRYPVDVPETYNPMTYFNKYMPSFSKYWPTISKYYPEMFNTLSTPEYYKYLPEVFWNFPETFKTYSDFYKYMPEVFKYFPEIYKYMPESYLKYHGQPEVPEVVYKYIYNMMKRYTPEIYGKHIPEIFRTYFPEVYTKFTPDILNVYNPEMHTTFRKYITSVLEHPEIEDMKKDILRSYIFRHIFTTPYSFLHDTIYSPEYELMRYVNKFYTPLYTPLSHEYVNEI